MYRKNFLGTQNRVRISHGIGAIGVRDVEPLLYVYRGWDDIGLLLYAQAKPDLNALTEEIRLLWRLTLVD